MCGIFASNDPTIPNSAGELLEKRLRFRGPDGSSGLVRKNNWSTYHSRLAIIDIAAGVNQPVINPDGSQLIFNGEILNYKELGHKYLGRDYTSDVKLLNDLILNRLLKAEELDGFFAFIFIDGDGRLAYACRDKFGVKPLFYFKTPDGYYAFSSEPSVLIDLYSLQRNEQAIAEYHAFRYPLFAKSFYSGISEVEAGTCLVNGKYFYLEDELARKSDCPSSQEELASAFNRGVTSRCVSDAPIGLLLSRGIDSNLIRNTHEFQKFYTIGFSEDDDIQFLEEQSIENLKIITTNPQAFEEAFAYLLELKGEPMSVPNEVLLYLVGKEAAADGIKVLLSGEGADEFFAGYDRIFRWAADKREFDLDEFASHYCYSDMSSDRETMALLRDALSGFETDSVFEKVRWFFIKYHLPVLFRRLDFSLMAAGIEGREPIANHHLFNIAKTLLAPDLMDRSLGKLPLRKLAEQYMGKEFAFAKKVGFPVDLTRVFANPNNLSSYELWFQRNLEILK